METLLVVITTWLSINFGLPAANHPPNISFVDRQGMIEVRASTLNQEEAERFRQTAFSSQRIVALYDDPSRTIFLPDDWSAASPADVSVLVHEMVHHLQNSASMTHACVEAREKLAYDAQSLWLEQVGSKLEDAFELDAITLLFMTKCYY